MSTGPVSGIQTPQSTGGPQSAGFDSEHLQIGAKGDERPTEVSKKKGRFGSPLRMVRKVYSAISHIGRKNVSAKQTNTDLKTTANKFKESVSQGKVTTVQPKNYLSTAHIQSRPLPAVPPQDSSMLGSSVQSMPKNMDLSQLPAQDLLAIVRNPKESSAMKTAAATALNQMSEAHQQSRSVQDTPPPVPKHGVKSKPDLPPKVPTHGNKSSESPPPLPEKTPPLPKKRSVQSQDVPPPLPEKTPPLPKKRSIQSQDKPPPLPDKPGQESRPPSPTPRKRVAGGPGQSTPVSTPKAQTVQQTVSQAVSLAKTGNAQGLAQLLNNVTDYAEAKAITQTIVAKLGNTNPAAYQMAMTKMADLKHQDLIATAKASGFDSPEQISQFAERTLDNHAFYQGHKTSIMEKLNAELRPQSPSDQPPELPPRPGSPTLQRTQGAGSGGATSFPGAEKLAAYYAQGTQVNDQEAFNRDFAAGLTLLVENKVTTRDSLERAIRDIEQNGDPLIDPDGVFDLVQRTAQGKGAQATPEMTNHKHYSELREYTRSHPVQTISTEHARFRDIASPSASNVPVRVLDSQGQVEFKKGKIHANSVPLSGRTGAIATQYPKDSPASKEMFWKMNLQQKTEMVVDLTQSGEKGLSPYYPTEVGQTNTFGSMKVTLVSQEAGLNNYQVTDTQSNESGQISRYHYQQWVDKTAISVDKLSELAVFVAGGDHTCIHCKAGVGRTMTAFAAAELLIKMRTGQITPQNIDAVVDQTIINMREARGTHAVQTESQRGSLVGLVNHWMQNGTP